MVISPSILLHWETVEYITVLLTNDVGRQTDTLAVKRRERKISSVPDLFAEARSTGRRQASNRLPSLEPRTKLFSILLSLLALEGKWYICTNIPCSSILSYSNRNYFYVFSLFLVWGTSVLPIVVVKILPDDAQWDQMHKKCLM